MHHNRIQPTLVEKNALQTFYDKNWIGL